MVTAPEIILLSRSDEDINLQYVTEIAERIQASYMLARLGLTFVGVKNSFFKKLSS